ncbi:MAG: hypothetical protein ACFFB3_11540 [Candidatus Hodarchaeota archaeon]
MTIEKKIQCPKCSKGTHIFILEVKRDHVLEATVAIHRLRRAYRKIDLLFQCPITSEDFQAPVTLDEDEISKIIAVSVIGAKKSD